MKYTFIHLLIALCSFTFFVACENPNNDVEDVVGNDDDDDGGGSGGGNNGKNDREKRYTVMEFINGNFSYQVWVKGYIVGSCYSNIKNADFTPPFDGSSALLLADRPGQTDLDSIIPIQLTGPRRTYCNLVDHPENFGCQAEFFGSKNTYFRMTGMKDDIGAFNLWDKDGHLVEQ